MLMPKKPLPPGQPIGVNVHCTLHPIREQSLSSQPSQKTLKTHHPNEEHKPRFPDSIAQPITIMPLSRKENTTFAMPSIIDSPDMGLRTVFTVRTPKRKRLFNAYGRGVDLSHPALLKKCLGGKTQNPNESLNSLIWKFCPKTIGSSLQIAEIASNLATSVFNDGNQILITSLEKFGLKINRNVCVSLAERDNRRIFTSRQRRLKSSFEARRAKKIKKSKEIELFQEQEGISYDPGAF
ncbi:uncharacterized protein TNCV_3611091 [Trichonephila clavipes]|nr:uncharacterized protein TNCV_3611091 [Trichonephila clavipes]